MNNTQGKALEYLQSLIGLEMHYGIKSPDLDLFDFGFSRADQPKNYSKRSRSSKYILHATCRFKIIWRMDEHRVEKYDESTSNDSFRFSVEQLLGHKIRRVALSKKNDLWLDFGDFWIVFATFENEEESWRFFASGANDPHLVASNTQLEFIF